jgi:hypothetical protein
VSGSRATGSSPQNKGKVLKTRREEFFDELEARLEKNLAFFRERMPGVYEQVNRQGLHDVDVDLDGDGEVVITIAGQKILQKQLVEEAEQHLALLKTSERPVFYIPTDIPVDVPEQYMPTDWDKLFYNPVDQVSRHALHRSISQYVRDGAEVAPLPVFGDKTIPILIVFGTGHGYHLQRLVEEYDIWQLIIIDNDPGIARLSMCLFDYQELLGKYLLGEKTVCRRAFSYIISNDSVEILDLLTKEILSSFPPYFVNGAVGFYSVRDTRLSAEIQAALTDWSWKFYRGWGFFDDEMLSLRHTVRNVRSNLPYAARPVSVPKGSTAFIVGSGPSLDGLVEMLKKHRDDAVVFACGTAGGILHRHGIVPDYHVEIERTDLTTETILRDLPQDYLDSVTLLGLSVLPPKVFELFKKGMMLFRPNDAGTQLFSKVLRNPPQFMTTPTVTNAGFDIALKWGFENIYLFGVDLGFVDNRQHHSTSSIYYAKQSSEAEGDAFGKVFSELTSKQFDDQKNLMRVKGNFQPVVSTTDIFSLAITAFEECARDFPTVKVFNLNDGAYIRGTIPLPPEKFGGLEGGASKEEAVRQISEAMADRYECDSSRVLKSFASDYAQYIKGIKEIFPSVLKLQRREDILVLLYRLYQGTSDDKARGSPPGILLRGSIMHMARLIYDYSLRLREDEKALAFAAEGFKVFTSYLTATGNVVSVLLDEARRRNSS